MRRAPRLLGLSWCSPWGVLAAALLLLSAPAMAAEDGDDFQRLLRHARVPESLYLPPGEPLTQQKALALWHALLEGSPTLLSFAPRTVLARNDYVDCDGFDPGIVLEVKGPGYLQLIRKMAGKEWFRAIDDMARQASRQLRATRGTRLQWHFAEKEVADLMRRVFRERNIQPIEVLHTPPAP